MFTRKTSDVLTGTAVVALASLAGPALADPGRRAGRRPAPARRGRPGSQPLQARPGPHREPPAGDRRPVGHVQQSRGQDEVEARLDAFLQGDAPSRMSPNDIGKWYVRNSKGEMVPFTAFGQQLSRQDVDDVVTLLRSWQRPPETAIALPPKPGGLKKSRSLALNFA